MVRNFKPNQPKNKSNLSSITTVFNPSMLSALTKKKYYEISVLMCFFHYVNMGHLSLSNVEIQWDTSIWEVGERI
ncbi:hypothetical protein ACSBR2_029002 [Camellia fascicularis]